MKIEKLNSTGSFTRLGNEYFSYDTRLSFIFKGEYFVNKTYYSITTRRHQSQLPEADFNRTLYYQKFGYYNEDRCIQFEIKELQRELENRLTKRKTQNNLFEIDRVSKKIQFLSKLLEE